MKIHIIKNLEEILELDENPTPLYKLAGKSALIFTPYFGDKIINRLRKGMIQDLTKKYKSQEREVDHKSIKAYANLIAGTILLGKYCIYAEVGYKLYNLLT